MKTAELTLAAYDNKVAKMTNGKEWIEVEYLGHLNDCNACAELYRLTFCGVSTQGEYGVHTLGVFESGRLEYEFDDIAEFNDINEMELA